jgi:hypothetical protein
MRRPHSKRVSPCYAVSMATYPEYIRAAMRRARSEQTDEGEWFASIPGFDGLWAAGPSVEDAREQLPKNKVAILCTPFAPLPPDTPTGTDQTLS